MIEHKKKLIKDGLDSKPFPSVVNNDKTVSWKEGLKNNLGWQPSV